MLEIAELQQVARQAREAARTLALVPAAAKDAVLLDLADRLESDTELVLAANRVDAEAAALHGMDAALVDRLLLTAERLAAMATDVRQIARLPDPVGEEIEARTLPNDLRIRRVRVPLGVIGVIYESRPNVTIDVAALGIKSGNAVLLRDGKEARRSNAALAGLVRDALRAQDVPAEAVQILSDPDRMLVGEMIRLRGLIDLVVPRGGAGLIEFVRENATVPVVTGGIGVCHTYVHATADLDKALAIVDNAKTRRPTICNALDTVLVDEAIAPTFLPGLATRWAPVPVEMRCDSASLAILQACDSAGCAIPAQDDDFGREFLSLRAAIKVVAGLEEAIGHIERYGSGHSEAIVTEDDVAAHEFLSRVDAAAVYVNASTQFTDGAQFGLGAELGISTQKFHARGPLGLREMTSYKWVIEGNGQVRE